MTIRAAGSGGARAREEPTQLELIQSHLKNKLRPKQDLGEKKINGRYKDIRRYREHEERVDLEGDEKFYGLDLSADLYHCVGCRGEGEEAGEGQHVPPGPPHRH